MRILLPSDQWSDIVMESLHIFKGEGVRDFLEFIGCIRTPRDRLRRACPHHKCQYSTVMCIASLNLLKNMNVLNRWASSFKRTLSHEGDQACHGRELPQACSLWCLLKTALCTVLCVLLEAAYIPQPSKNYRRTQKTVTWSVFMHGGK